MYARVYWYENVWLQIITVLSRSFPLSSKIKLIIVKHFIHLFKQKRRISLIIEYGRDKLILFWKSFDLCIFPMCVICDRLPDFNSQEIKWNRVIFMWTQFSYDEIEKLEHFMRNIKQLADYKLIFQFQSKNRKIKNR